MSVWTQQREGLGHGDLLLVEAVGYEDHPIFVHLIDGRLDGLLRKVEVAAVVIVSVDGHVAGA
jgi:hypothetical protein